MVQSCDTVYLGTIPLKRFKVNNNLIQSIIEGVGCNGGLIEPGSMCLYYHSESVLICYKTDYNVLTVNSNYPCTLSNNGGNCQAVYTYNSTGLTYSFTNSSTGADSITNFYWDFNDGTPLYWNNNSPNHMFNTPGNYYVCLHIQTSNGCQSYTCDTITVNLTGINEDFNNNSFTISPNPFSSMTTLHTNKVFKNATLKVYNLCGQQVKQIKNICGQTITLHRDNLSSGLYFLRLTEDNKTFTTDKLIITDN
jgi:hypothetical protein